jgi:hypothetical protein
MRIDENPIVDLEVILGSQSGNSLGLLVFDMDLLTQVRDATHCSRVAVSGPALS